MTFSITLAQKRHKEAGGDFFEKKNMKRLDSKVESNTIQNGYFITSQASEEFGRIYLVRRITDNWSRVRLVNTFDSIRAAKHFLKDLVKS